MTSTVTSPWAMFSTVSEDGRPSNASWVMKRAAVKPAHSTTAVTIAIQKYPPPQKWHASMVAPASHHDVRQPTNKGHQTDNNHQTPGAVSLTHSQTPPRLLYQI